MENDKNINVINVIILGDKEVGKTSIFNFIKENNSIQTDINNDINDIDCFILKATYEKKNITISLNIKDIKNPENFKGNMPIQYIRNNHIVLLVFSDLKSLNNIKENWYKFNKENTNIENTRYILIGNKADLFGDERDEIIKQGNIFAEEIDAHFITSSVISKDNMDNLERYIITEAKRFIDEEDKKLNEKKNNIELKEKNEDENENNSDNGKCCVLC